MIKINIRDEDVCRWRDLLLASGWTYDKEKSESDVFEKMFKEIIGNEKLVKIISEHLTGAQEVQTKPLPTVVKPKDTLTNTIARVFIDDRFVRVEFLEKNERFNSLVKGIGYSWKRPFFERRIRNGTVSLMDAAAELCHNLLVGGFCFIAPNEDISQMAISGNYQKDPHRWVFRRSMGQYKDWFAIHWDERNDDLYQLARKITVSRWDSPFAVVPLEHYQEVRDFANRYGFGFTNGAMALMKIAEAMEAESLELVPLPIQPLPEVSTERLLLKPVITEVAYELADDNESI